MVTKLTLEYDGTEFAGWARQPGLRSVQEELERALRTVLGEQPGADRERCADRPGPQPSADGQPDAEGQPLALTVAGRTDRGVHAWGQVGSYPHEAVDPQRLNSLLPRDISVLAAEPAPAGFDARRDASSRTYCYRVLARRTRGVFARGRALWWPRQMEQEALRECAAALVGRHDFTAFTPTETEHQHFERTIVRAEWRIAALEQRAGPDDPDFTQHLPQLAGEHGELLEFWIEADTFLRHMNRVLVGTMLEVAAGRRTLSDFKELLEGRPREQAGPTAPAHGLALASVSYRSS